MGFVVNESQNENGFVSVNNPPKNYTDVCLYSNRTYCKDKECEPPYGGKEVCELRDNEFCSVD